MMTIMWLLLLALVLLARRFSAPLYDIVIVNMTARWYAAVLELLPPGSRVLDVGIGTASALARNRQAIHKKKLRIVGMDYDAPYIARAREVVAGARLGDVVALECCSIYEEGLGARLAKLAKAAADDDDDGTKFDAVYFSGSLMVMPQPAEALRVAGALLRPGGKIYITQTLQRRYVPGLAQLKPLLFYLTTIDFGQLVYEGQLTELLEGVGMELLHDGAIAGSVDTPLQAAHLVVCKPAAAAAAAAADTAR